MVKIKGTTIKMTKGDTLRCQVIALQGEDEGNVEDVPYIPVQGDRVRFAMKRNYKDNVCLIKKEIPIDTMILELVPKDTKNLPAGDYVYDVELTYGIDGAVDTFIANAQLVILEEVD